MTNKVKVLIADDLAPGAADIFKNRGIEVDFKVGLKKDELIKIIGEYDGLAVRSACKPDKDVIAAGTKLKVIGRAGIGVDNVDVKAATAKGVIVMNTPFGNAITTAEHAIAMMFAAARQIPSASQRTHAGEWPKKDYIGIELYAKTLGLIGAGNIGSIVADRALGLKMKVVAYDPFLTAERATHAGRREGRARRAAGARRRHHAAHAADRADQEHPVGGEPRQDEEGRDPDQLRPWRPCRRGGGSRGPR